MTEKKIFWVWTDLNGRDWDKYFFFKFIPPAATSAELSVFKV